MFFRKEVCIRWEGKGRKDGGLKNPGTNQLLQEVSSKERKQLFQDTHDGQRSQRMKSTSNFCANQRIHVQTTGTMKDRTQGAGESDRKEDGADP